MAAELGGAAAKQRADDRALLTAHGRAQDGIQMMDGAQIGAGIDQMSRESVAKRVRGHALTRQHLSDHFLEHLAHGSSGERAIGVAAREQQRPRWAIVLPILA